MPVRPVINAFVKLNPLIKKLHLIMQKNIAAWNSEGHNQFKAL